MTPIRDTPDNLHTARAVGRTRISDRILLLLWVRCHIRAIEPLLEVSSYLLPMFAMRVPNDRLIWCNFDVVRKGKPVVFPIIY